MPERPDLDYAVPILREQLVGRRLEGFELHKPTILRMALEGEIGEVMTGRSVVDVRRHGHFLEFEVDGQPRIQVILAPMLAGRVRVSRCDARLPRDIAARWPLDDERELRYRDDVQMGKLYVIPHGETARVPGFDTIGIDVLSRAFTRKALTALTAKRRDQLKVFLLDKTALDSLGNAYADEVLFHAGLHPKTWVRDLGDDELGRLHKAIRSVLREASAEIAARKPETDEKIRDFLKVRGRHKQPCPRCQTPIRKAGVRGHDAFFCPSCQPETRKGGIVRWRG